MQAKRFINYFDGRGAISFQFRGKPYAVYIENTACFPQSFSAAVATVKNLTASPKVLVVDIGGFTADYVRLRNGVPDMSACDSLENGVILLYNRVRARANAELDVLLDESEIDCILRGEHRDVAPEVVELVEKEAQEFINDLLSGLREAAPICCGGRSRHPVKWDRQPLWRTSTPTRRGMRICTAFSTVSGENHGGQERSR